LKEKIDDYLNERSLLNAVRIDFGDNEYYKWIPKGCRYFSELLDEANISYELAEHAGGHVLNRRLVENNMLLFFSENLQY